MLTRYDWVFHPESPGVRILVCRSFWQRLVRPKDFATYDEVKAYQELCTQWRVVPWEQ